MTLTAADLDQHVALGIDPRLLERQQVCRVDDRASRDLLALNGRAGDLSGIAYPYLWPGRSGPLAHRVRRDRPEMENGKPKNKYLFGYGDRRHLYLACDDLALLSDIRIPIVFVESEKAVLAITSVAARQSRPLLSLGTGGCFGWRGRIGKTEAPNGARVDETGVLPDFDHLTWTGREVTIAFDSNLTSNATVQTACRQLADELARRGAIVRILRIPIEPGINGPDDFIGRHGDAAFLGLLDAATPADAGVGLEDFFAYMPTHSYLFAPSRELWPASSVDQRLPWVTVVTPDGSTKDVSPSRWLDKHKPIEMMTWAPGLPMVIRDRLVSDGGWIDRRDCAVFNLYRPPPLLDGDPGQAAPWIEHLYRVYPTEAEHLTYWFAHRVQRPDEKANHAIVLGGLQGIGKDSLLQPLKHAVGAWNFVEVSPGHLLGRFNGYVKSVILRISEARDLGDIDRYAFYEHLKSLTAAPPDVLRCDEKNLREYAVWNVCGIVLTTNHRHDGIYLPADDRRHFVAWSERTKDDFTEGYWRELWQWYGAGGVGHVAAYLRTLDLAGFNAKAPPPKTSAFFDIVDANRAPEDADLADTIEALDRPAAVTLEQLAKRAPSTTFAEWLRDRKSARQVPHRMESAGYVPVRNPDRPGDGLWRIEGRRQVVYARHDLSLRDRILAARELG